MGVIEKIRCNACKHSWECRTGCGLLHGNLVNIAKAYPEEIAERIREYEKQSPPVQFEFQYRLAVCKNCNKVLSVPVFKIRSKEELLIGKCPACGETVDLIQELENEPCAICHSPGMIRQKIGMWD